MVTKDTVEKCSDIGTTGNAQGFEEGYAQPSATYGFDIKVSF